MFDFRLKVFYAVAKRLNFTKAANELYITQPAVTKHIRELEAYLKISLIERSGNRKVSLTPAGAILLEHAERIMSDYKELEIDMNALIQSHKGDLRIGASNTIGQYVLPQILAKFHKRFQDIRINLITGNTEQIEQALLNKDIDLGAIEGVSRNPQISYEAFLNDELVLVTATQNPLLKKDTITLEQLKNVPLVIREQGSGSLDVVFHALKSHNIKPNDLKIEMKLGNTESIKAYLENSNCAAFLSVHSVWKELKSNELKIVDVSELSIERSLYFIHLHGQPAALSELFMRFAQNVKQDG